MPLKTRPELEAEAMRLIRVVNENIVLDAKEVLVRALDQMQVDGMHAAADIAESVAREEDKRKIGFPTSGEYQVGCRNVRQAINAALENREKI